MPDPDDLQLARLLPSISIVALYLAGCAYAFWQLKRHPKAARLAIAGLVALTLHQAISIWLQFFAQTEPTVGESAIPLAKRLVAIGWTLYGLWLAGTGILILAVFAGRAPHIERRDA